MKRTMGHDWRSETKRMQLLLKAATMPPGGKLCLLFQTDEEAARFMEDARRVLTDLHERTFEGGDRGKD